MTDIVIVAAARTAVGKFGGTLAKTPASELGAVVIKDLLRRTGLAGDQIGEVILGQVLQAGCGQNPARQAVIKSGLPHGFVQAFSRTIRQRADLAVLAWCLGIYDRPAFARNFVVAGQFDLADFEPGLWRCLKVPDGVHV